MMLPLHMYRNLAVWWTLLLLFCHACGGAAASSSSNHASIRSTRKRHTMQRLVSSLSHKQRNARLLAARVNPGDDDDYSSHRMMHLDTEPILSFDTSEETTNTRQREKQEKHPFHMFSALKRLFTRPTQSVWPIHHSAPSLSKAPSSRSREKDAHHETKTETTLEESVESETTTSANNTSMYDPLEPFLSNQTQHVPATNQTQTLLDTRDLIPALALPSSLFPSLKNKIISILRHPNLPKWTLHGLQLGIAIYLLDAVAKAASQVLDEMSSDSSPHLLNPNQVEQILASLDPSQEQPNKDTSSVLEERPTLLALTSTLLASGMPLRASSSLLDSTSSNSVEQILLSLTKSEANIVQQCLWIPSPKDSFASIAGLQSIKQSLLDVIWTIQQSTQQQENPYSHLVKKPPGILLYGPPGCGKSMLVKALAASTKIPCLVVTPSVLLRKYVGETNLQVRALFSLAQKLSPCILCIDELDGLFRERSSTEHDVSRDLKTEFLQWWDGIASNGHMLIVGATNRPFEVDSAVLRRMPQSYFVGLPNYHARKSVLSTMLNTIPTSSDVQLHPLAAETEGYTPSDLTQVVRMAITTGPIREARFSLKYRPLSMKDIGHAKSIVSPTPLTPGYRAALSDYAQRNSATTHQVHDGNNDNSAQDNNPWDSFFHAGEIHASTDSHFTLPEWNDNGDSQAVDDSSLEEDYSYDDDEAEESDNDL